MKRIDIKDVGGDCAGENRRDDMVMNDLSEELAALLNKHSVERLSNTPDYVLAEFLAQCLVAWNDATRKRELHYRSWENIGPKEPINTPETNNETRIIGRHRDG